MSRRRGASWSESSSSSAARPRSSSPPALAKAGIPILGTSPDAIDLAEDRERFAALVNRLGLRQPENGIARSRDEAIAVAERIGYPVLTRPSYVLGGRAMEVVDGPAQLDDYIHTAVQVSGDSPVLIDRYLRDAIEVDVDAICDGKDVCIAGVMQHIEEAGVHSGDSACSLPPYSLEPAIIEEIEKQARALALALGVVGLMNVQFAVKDDVVYLIEVNPRASRTVPFVAKAIGAPIAKIAARVMAGESLMKFLPIQRSTKHIAVKEAVFPFARFPGIDPVLSPEMKSTGEVMGIDLDFPTAFLKSQLASGIELPNSRHIVRLGQGQRQGADRSAGSGADRIWLRGDRDRRHRRFSRRRGSGRRAGQQGRAGKAAYRRPDQGQGRRHHLQHHRRLAEPQGFRVDPGVGADGQGSLLHHRRLERRGGPGDRGAALAQP